MHDTGEIVVIQRAQWSTNYRCFRRTNDVGMGSGLRWVLAFAATVVAGVLVAMPAASADVVTPPGSCAATGTWRDGRFTERSVAHDTGDVIEIPRADTVRWTGRIRGSRPGVDGPRRPINGAIQLELPIGQVTIDDWGGTSVKYANTGAKAYDLPSILVGVKMKLSGYHDDNGRRTCSGSVYMKVEGDTFENPLSWAAIGGLVISGGLLLYAGRPVLKKVRED